MMNQKNITFAGAAALRKYQKVIIIHFSPINKKLFFLTLLLIYANTFWYQSRLIPGLNLFSLIIELLFFKSP